jgi:aminoglycoside phosphotransferase (APT) family kinase protein
MEGELENLLVFFKGSFNFSFRFSFGNGRPDVIIRFPKPGHTATAYRDKKVANEVQIMEYLHQNTNIPIPRIHSWGLTADSLQHLRPFIIIDYIDGTLLSTILKQPDQEDIVLNPGIDNITLDEIYYQITN